MSSQLNFIALTNLFLLYLNIIIIVQYDGKEYDNMFIRACELTRQVINWD